MTAPTEDRILNALRMVVDPSKGKDIVTAGMVSGLSISGDTVSFAIEVDPSEGAKLEPLRQAAEAAVKRLDGVGAVMAALTAHSETPSAPQAAPSAPAQRPGHGRS